MLKVNKKAIYSLVLAGGIVLLPGCGHIIPEANDKLIDEETTTETITHTTTKIATNATTKTTTTTETTSNTTSTTTSTTTTMPETTTTYTTTNVEIEPVTEPITTDFVELPVEKEPQKLDYNQQYVSNWRYVNANQYYLPQEGDTIYSLSEKFNLTDSQFLYYNQFIDPNNIELENVGQVRYPIKQEYYQLSGNETLDFISIMTGVDQKELIELNLLEENYDTTKLITNKKEIMTHVYVGNETSYDTYLGQVNMVHNNRLMGKIIYGTGYAGASQKVLVQTEDPFIYGRNHVYFYQFDGSNNIIYKELICTNAKEISNKQGMFSITLRTDRDVADYMNSVGATDPLQFISSDYDEENYNVDEYGNPCLLFSGVNKAKQYNK